MMRMMRLVNTARPKKRTHKGEYLEKKPAWLQ